MSSSGEKVVQTTLGRDGYERLRGVAEEEGKSLKQVLRDAVAKYVEHHYAVDPEDPLFVAEAFEGEETDAAETDEYLYG